MLGLSKLRVTEIILVVATVVVWCVTIVVDQNRSYLYAYVETTQEILRQTAFLGIFALGAAVVIISGGIDLSAGSMIALSGAVFSVVLYWLDPNGVQSVGLQSDVATQLGITSPAAVQAIWIAEIAVAAGAAILTGVCVGSLHAWLITTIGLPPFVATLATLVGLRSFARLLVLTVADSSQIDVQDDQIRVLGTTVWFAVVVFVLLAAAVWFLLSFTVVGRHLYAIGGNEEAARLSGIQTDGVKWTAYCISSVTASLAGILFVAQQAVADPEKVAAGYELNAIAAAVVGGCSLQGGMGSILGVALGTLFLSTVVDAVGKVVKSGSDYFQGLIVGIVVVFAVAASQFQVALSQRRAVFPGVLGGVNVITLAILAGGIGWFGAGPVVGAVMGGLALILLTAVKIFQTFWRSG